jgi:hypothetical protein
MMPSEAVGVRHVGGDKLDAGLLIELAWAHLKNLGDLAVCVGLDVAGSSR